MTGGDQLFCFLTCASCGIASGVFYDVLYCLRTAFSSRVATVVCDVLFCLLLAVLYLFASLAFGLPVLRLYPVFGIFVGLLLYLKSFHEIVAFFVKKVYNNLIQRKRRKDMGNTYAK